jgi:hypothetical protein
MQVSLGRRFAVEKRPNAEGSTLDVEFKVILPNPYTLYFIHECGVLSGWLLKVGDFRRLALHAL